MCRDKGVAEGGGAEWEREGTGGEEARNPKRARDPAQPTKAEWEAHQANHLPYRSWCKYCVEGRLDNPPHRRRPSGAEEPALPEIHLDYAFVKRDGEERTTTILVAKHRQSRAVRCWVVPRKGRSEAVAAELAFEGIRGFGVGEGQRIVVKSDNEEAILSLRRRVLAMWPGGSLEQEPAAYEHESNGVIESGVRLGKGLLRVHLLSLEGRLRGRIPCSHPVFAWLVGHSSSTLTKYLVGKDGRTPYFRLSGKELSEEGLEFGERLRWRPPNVEGRNVLLEARWKEGVWLGRLWCSPVHYVFDPETKTVKEVRAVQRMPLEERWSLEAVQAVSSWPRLLDPEKEEEEAKILPSDAPVEEGPLPAERRQANPAFLTQADFDKYGYTEGCAKCTRIRGGLPSRGWKHTPGCRSRVEARLREAGDPRISAADRRATERIVDITGDLSEPQAGREEEQRGEGRRQEKREGERREGGQERHEERRVGDERVRGESPEVQRGGGTASGSDAAARLPQSMPSPGGAPRVLGSNLEEGMDPEVDAMIDEMEEDAAEDGMMMGRLGSMVKSMPEDLRNTVRELLELYALNGVSNKDAEKAVAELFSPPRVTKELRRMRARCPQMKLVPGATFDLTEDEHGNSYNVLKLEDRKRVRERVSSDEPWLVIGCPPCVDYSFFNVTLNHKKMDPKELKRRLVEREVFLRFAVEIYVMQISAGRHFLHEHPLGATSWEEELLKDLAKVKGVGTVIGHLCEYGLTTPAAGGGRLPAKKATRFLSSAPAILEQLGRKCSGNHRHQRLHQSRPAAAAIYPPQLCRAILRGAEEQRLRDHRPVPPLIGRLQQSGLGVFALRREGGRGKGDRRGGTEEKESRRKKKEDEGDEGEELEVDEGVLDQEVEDEDAALGAYSSSAGPTSWTTSSARLPQSPSTVYDEYTGDVLPSALVAAAREEEVAAMESDEWHVWGEVDIKEAWERTGKKPLKGRWVDVNKGGHDNPDVRSRWVAKEVNTYRTDAFFASTPPLEAMRLILSAAATKRKRGEEHKVMLLDAKKAHLHAPAARQVYVELPPERAKPGRCCRLVKCLYGTRDAPQQWEKYAAKTLQELGFIKGKACATCFYHPLRQLRCLVHGDDFLFSGKVADLEWVKAEMKRTILFKDGGRLGPDQGEVRELRCLNRVLRWTARGLELEADPRHAEILAALLGDNVKPVTTPGVKEQVSCPRGRTKPAEEESASEFAARSSARAEKVADLNREIRILAEKLRRAEAKEETMKEDGRKREHRERQLQHLQRGGGERGREENEQEEENNEERTRGERENERTNESYVTGAVRTTSPRESEDPGPVAPPPADGQARRGAQPDETVATEVVGPSAPRGFGHLTPEARRGQERRGAHPDEPVATEVVGARAPGGLGHQTPEARRGRGGFLGGLRGGGGAHQEQGGETPQETREDKEDRSKQGCLKKVGGSKGKPRCKVCFGGRTVFCFVVPCAPWVTWASVSQCRRAVAQPDLWQRKAGRRRPAVLEAFGRNRCNFEGDDNEDEHYSRTSCSAPLPQSNRLQLDRLKEEKENDVDEVLDDETAGWFRGAAARANYLAMDRVDISYSAKELCRRMSVPRRSDLVALRRLAKYLLGVPRLVQLFEWQNESGFDVYADTDFAGCPRTRRSTSGGICLRGRHSIKHWSKTQKTVTLSSAEAELGGVVLAACEGLGVQAVARDLGLGGGLALHADSAAAIGICNRSGIGRVRHLAVGQLWIQERIRDHSIKLHKVLGTENPADLCTKYLSVRDLLRCVTTVNGQVRQGRSEAAPAMAAEVVPFLAEAKAEATKRGEKRRERREKENEEEREEEETMKGVTKVTVRGGRYEAGGWGTESA